MNSSKSSWLDTQVKSFAKVIKEINLITNPLLRNRWISRTLSLLIILIFLEFIYEIFIYKPKEIATNTNTVQSSVFRQKDFLKLQESFKNANSFSDPLLREYYSQQESKRFNQSPDEYRHLFQVYQGNKEVFPDYPQNRLSVVNWLKWWFIDLTRNQRFNLIKNTILATLRPGSFISIIIFAFRYLIEAPQREKQKHYQAWQIINSGTGKQNSGGRIEALQDLNKDGVSLEGLQAQSANLEGIYLQGSDLNSTYLSGAILIGASLQGANLQGADLKGANLQGANLQGANLQGVNLQGASLQGASLQGADLKEADLREAKFLNTHLENANLQKTILTVATLTRANLQGANLQEANLQGADLKEANLQGANLHGVKNVTKVQIQLANNWRSASYDQDFRKQLYN